MKITKSQLKQIIKEELEEAQKIPQSNKEKRRAIEKKAKELAAADGKDWSQIKDPKVYKQYRARAAQELTSVDPGATSERQEINKEAAENLRVKMEKIKKLIHGSGFDKRFIKEDLPDPELLQHLDDLDMSMGYIIQRLVQLTA